VDTLIIAGVVIAVFAHWIHRALKTSDRERPQKQAKPQPDPAPPARLPASPDLPDRAYFPGTPQSVLDQIKAHGFQLSRVMRLWADYRLELNHMILLPACKTAGNVRGWRINEVLANPKAGLASGEFVCLLLYEAPGDTDLTQYGFIGMPPVAARLD